MTKCPNCGSTAQPKIIDIEYFEDGWDITVVRHYKCGCEKCFTGTTVYTCQDAYELIET